METCSSLSTIISRGFMAPAIAVGYMVTQARARDRARDSRDDGKLAGMFSFSSELVEKRIYVRMAKLIARKNGTFASQCTRPGGWR
jgi:hypothetical protein